MSHHHAWIRMPEFDKHDVDKLRCLCGQWAYVTWGSRQGRKVNLYAPATSAKLETELHGPRRRPPETGRPPVIDPV
jgi:hypothetical protein